MLYKEQSPLFSNYRKAPWLIRKVSITRLPPVSSLVALRTIPRRAPSRRAFVGFRDPVFDPEQLAQMKKERAGHKVILSSQSEIWHVRGIRITETGSLDNEKIISSHLDSLNRLRIRLRRSKASLKRWALI